MPAVPMPSGIGGQVFDTLATPGAGFGWAGFRPLRVARIVMESASVVSIHLADPDGGRLLRPEAGQYLTVRVGGAAEPAQVRNYSLSGCPSDAEYRISVKRQEHGVVSNYLHTRLRIGDLLDIAAPRGDFVLAEPASDRAPVLLISAGVGATPVLAMLHALAERGSAREIWWLHSAHSAAEHAFAAESHQLLAGLGRQHEHIFYTVPAPPNRLTAETLAALHLPTDASVYLCGPTSFMSAIRAALVAAGLDPSRIHTELFGSLPAINPGIIDTPDTAPHQPPGPTGTGPRITFTRSAITVPWSDTYPTILDLAEACDIPTRWSCRTGVCHTCRTQILSGTIRYQPDPLELPASDTTLICCAQPETDLILDL
ncbi:2Fe-2S iron-sulfur cluster-binding protein [Nocardia pseudobrasiliensis]|nr:2Fe-2S iron-sulfur cluster-binding protein [Nocardia pseudobrasiliensis]